MLKGLEGKKMFSLAVTRRKPHCLPGPSLVQVVLVVQPGDPGWSNGTMVQVRFGLFDTLGGSTADLCSPKPWISDVGACSLDVFWMVPTFQPTKRIPARDLKCSVLFC